LILFTYIPKQYEREVKNLNNENMNVYSLIKII
jgi:hypothetical protein